MTEAPQIPLPEHRVTTNNHYAFHGFVRTDGSLTESAEELLTFAIDMISEACYLNSKAHGWYDQVENHADRNFGEICALYHSEISEAFEEYRNGDDPTAIEYEYNFTGGETVRASSPPVLYSGTEVGKPVGVASELADTLIRIFDTKRALDIPLAKALIEKHNYNFTRPYRHGNKKA